MKLSKEAALRIVNKCDQIASGQPDHREHFAQALADHINQRDEIAGRRKSIISAIDSVDREIKERTEHLTQERIKYEKELENLQSNCSHEFEQTYGIKHCTLCLKKVGQFDVRSH